jgi:hypothetical protein
VQNGEPNKDNTEQLDPNSSGDSRHSADSECGTPLVDWDEDRIDIISKNGNDGLHYTEIDG